VPPFNREPPVEIALLVFGGLVTTASDATMKQGRMGVPKGHLDIGYELPPVATPTRQLATGGSAHDETTRALPLSEGMDWSLGS
jgi:hypothetical protein